MPTCAAINCTNNTGSGLKMSYFPLQDPERCAIWIKNVGRRQWEPTKNSVLCQWHFAPEMWQNRSDMLKLKNDAVPTLFGHLDNRLLEQIPTECSSKEAVHLNVMDNKVITEPEKNDSLISNESTIDLSSDNNSINTSGMTEESLAEDKDEFTQSDKMNYDGDCANCFELEKKLNKYQAMYNKMCLSQKKYKQAMRSLKLKNQRLEKNQVYLEQLQLQLR